MGNLSMASCTTVLGIRVVLPACCSSVQKVHETQTRLTTPPYLCSSQSKRLRCLLPSSPARPRQRGRGIPRMYRFEGLANFVKHHEETGLSRAPLLRRTAVTCLHVIVSWPLQSPCLARREAGCRVYRLPPRPLSR